jgi:hypothetical protein
MKTAINRIVAGAAVLVLMAVSSDAVVNIQNIGSGARASSLGNAFVAVADNADAVFANPAGLHQLKGTQLAYTNVSLLFSGIDGDNLGQHVVSYARPGNKMSLGLGYERIGSDLLSENGAFLSLGFKLSPKLSLGVTAKYVFWSVGDIPNDAVSGLADPLSNQSQGAIGADIGLLWKAPIRDARVGLLLKNALQPNVAKGSVKNTDGSDAGDVPMDLHIGVSTSVAEASMVSVQWVMRDLTGEETDKRLVVGGETKVAEGFMLRAGGSKIFEDEASGDVNAGLGYKWNKTQFDYGYHIPLDLTETNGSHRFSLGYLF